MDPKHTGSAVHEGTRCEVTLGSLTLSRAALLSPGLIHQEFVPFPYFLPKDAPSILNDTVWDNLLGFSASP